MTFGGSGVHVLLALPYIKMLATEEQKQRYLPPFVAAEEMWALAMTEPGTGSDVAASVPPRSCPRTAPTTCSTAPRPSSPAACWPTG